jgi:hypothetical protein
MPSIASPTLLGIGLAVLLVGIWLWRWSSRNAIDVKGAAIGAAWHGVRKGELAVPEDIKSKLDAIAAEKGHLRQATKAGTTVARHFLAKVVFIGSLMTTALGLGLTAAGIWWN